MKRIQHSSKAQQYSYIVIERTQLRVRRMGPIRRLIARYKYHFFYTRYPEDILEVAAIMGIVLVPLMIVGLVISTIMGAIRWIIRFYEILYWAQGIKMDRTRYLIRNDPDNPGEPIREILESHAEKMRRERRNSKETKKSLREQKKMDRRTLAKN